MWPGALQFWVSTTFEGLSKTFARSTGRACRRVWVGRGADGHD